MPTDTPKTDELYAKIWLPTNEDEVDESLGTLRDHARQMEREVGLLRSALHGVLPIFRGKFLHTEEHQKVAAAHDALANTKIRDGEDGRSPSP